MTMADKTANFITQNLKLIVTIATFFVGLYVQHRANTMEIERLQREVARIDGRLDAQYSRLDNVKLDKSVFEATIQQFSTMSNDIRDIRMTLEDMMANGHYNSNHARQNNR
jgi:hypothetical protein